MKQIVNGKTYNTETATYLCSVCNYSSSDFKHFEEALYKTQKGNYFLAGHGNAMSKYHTCDGNSWSGGSAIIPLTVDEAKEWMEEYSHVDQYLAEFPETEEA